MFLVPSNKRSILNSTLSLLQQQQHHHNTNHHQSSKFGLDSPTNQISHIILEDNKRTSLPSFSFSTSHLKSFKEILKLLIKSSAIVFKFLFNSIWTLKRWAKLSTGVLVAILNPTTLKIRRFQTRPLSSLSFDVKSWPTIYGSQTGTRDWDLLRTIATAGSSIAIGSIAANVETVKPIALSESLSSFNSECNYSCCFKSHNYSNGTNFSGTNYKQRGFKGSNNSHHYQQLKGDLDYYQGMDLRRRRIAQRTSSLNNNNNSNNTSNSSGNKDTTTTISSNINNNHVDPNSAAACFWRLHSLPQASSNGASALRLLDDGEEAQGNSWNQEELYGHALAEGHQRRQLLRRDRKQAASAIVEVAAATAASTPSQTPIEHFQGQQQTGLQKESDGLSSEPEIGERLYKYDILLKRQTSGHQQQSKQQQQQQRQEVFLQQQHQQHRARIVDKHDLHSHQLPNNFDFNLKYFGSINNGNSNNNTTDCITHSPSSTLMSSLFTPTNHHQPPRLQKQQTQKQSYSYNNHLTVTTTGRTKENNNVTLEEDVGRSLLVDANADGVSSYQTAAAVSNRIRNEQNNHFQDDSNSCADLVVVSKRALSNITDQIAFSMSKMKHLEEQVKVIPELQRKLEHVMSDVASSTTSLHTTPVKQSLGHSSSSNNNNHHHHSNNNSNSQQQQHFNQPLDCGCQSFREHLRYNYNSISREQRLNHYMKSQTLSSTNNSLNAINGNHNQGSHITSSNHLVSPIRQLTSNSEVQYSKMKADASTNTELSMSDIVTRLEVDSLVAAMQKTYSSISSSMMMTSRNRLQQREDAHSDDSVESQNKKEKRSSFVKSFARKSSSSTSTSSSTSSSSRSQASTSGSISGPKSSSPVYSRSDSCEDDARVGDDDEEGDADADGECYSNKCIIDENEDLGSQLSDKVEDEISDRKGQELQQQDCDKSSNHDNHEHIYDNNNVGDKDDEDDDDDDGTNWLSGDQEPYSLGSSYQDPSDFEEYCAYGESLDRRTKDFMSQSTKIPNDLRFALIRLNDFIRRNKSFDQIKTSSSCIEVIRKEWFQVTASKDSQALKTKLYIDYFESFTKQLLNTVVNLTDSAGNTAMHYAASHYKLDIIKVLLATKVCDVNCRNRAGYTPIMLLALAEIDIFDNEQREIARRLFSLGDVNIKARTSGQTALMLAASHGRKNTCKLLLDCGADPSMQDYDGSTALMCGSEVGDEEVVRCLLAHKLTDPTAVDNDGLDALTIAMNNGHKSIGLMLYAAKNVPRMNRFANNVVVGSGSSINCGPSVAGSASAGANSSNLGGESSAIKAYTTFNTSTSGYLGASLRRSRGRLATNYVRRADSLLGSRSARATIRH